jgi:hypothetical protein
MSPGPGVLSDCGYRLLHAYDYVMGIEQNRRPLDCMTVKATFDGRLTEPKPTEASWGQCVCRATVLAVNNSMWKNFCHRKI